jgi:SulP family sulfate permease
VSPALAAADGHPDAQNGAEQPSFDPEVENGAAGSAAADNSGGDGLLPRWRRRMRQSLLVTEAHDLQPLLKSTVTAASASVSSFASSSWLVLSSYCLGAPAELRTSASYFYSHPAQLRLEVLLGVSLSALLVVDAIAFSLTAGTLPIIGMYACFILTLFASVFGGCSGMVSGAAGSTAAVQAAIMSDSGAFSDLSSSERLQLLFFILLLAGLLEVAVGWLGLAQLATIIPTAVMWGFMSGLAIIIFRSQLQAFQYCPLSSSNFTVCTDSQRDWLPAAQLTTWLTVVHALLAMLIMDFVHRLPVPHIRAVPAVLIAAVIGTSLEYGVFRAAISHPTRTVGDTAAINGSLPSVSFPSPVSSLSSSLIGQVILEAVLVAFVGLVESILTVQALNVRKEVRSTVRDFNTESVAQGLGNIACSLTGALGGWWASRRST